MKLRLVLEVEVRELPKSARKELADGINFEEEGKEILDEEDEDYLPPVPTLQEYAPDEIEQAVTEGVEGLFSSYEMQSELWAGSEFYGYLSDATIVETTMIDTTPPKEGEED